MLAGALLVRCPLVRLSRTRVGSVTALVSIALKTFRTFTPSSVGASGFGATGLWGVILKLSGAE